MTTTEAALLRAWRGGDPAAGRRLIDTVHPRLVRYFSNKVANVSDEADLVQRTLLALVEGHERLLDDCAFWPFAYGIARNVLRDYVRQRLRVRREELDFQRVCVRDLDRSMSSIVAGQREGRAFVEALRDIAIDDQILLELRFFERMRAREIAEVIGIPRGSVHQALRRSLERLQDKVRARLREHAAETDDPTLERLDAWAAEVRAALRR